MGGRNGLLDSYRKDSDLKVQDLQHPGDRNPSNIVEIQLMVHNCNKQQRCFQGSTSRVAA